MLKWTVLILIIYILDVAYTLRRRIYIVQVDKNNKVEIPAPPTIDVPLGANLTLRCALASDHFISEPHLTWGRRTRNIQFRNDFDLNNLLENNNKHILNLQNESDHSGLKHFVHFKSSDQGTYFCMTAKYKLFKVVHIKVKNATSPSCSDGKFMCISNGFCISSHYICDGKEDCPDGSDELWELCYDPCEGKFKCDDGRCIPKSWCCDKYTDDYCIVVIRHHCCPFLPNPYDPLNFYYNQNITKEISRAGGPRYLFIAVCVVSAVLSFVLFLFIISKVCGFDKKPQRLHDNTTNNEIFGETISNCGHSECAIHRELASGNSYCLYHAEEVSDPLINVCANNDQPPSYAEAVNTPPSIHKTTLEDLIDIPPPSYASTKNNASDLENRSCDTNL